MEFNFIAKPVVIQSITGVEVRIGTEFLFVYDRNPSHGGRRLLFVVMRNFSPVVSPFHRHQPVKSESPS